MFLSHLHLLSYIGTQQPTLLFISYYNAKSSEMFQKSANFNLRAYGAMKLPILAIWLFRKSLASEGTLTLSPLPVYRERGKIEAAGNPAIGRVIDVVEAGLRNRQAGFDAERVALAELRDSENGRKLMGEFFARQAARKKN